MSNTWPNSSRVSPSVYFPRKKLSWGRAWLKAMWRLCGGGVALPPVLVTMFKIGHPWGTGWCCYGCVLAHLFWSLQRWLYSYMIKGVLLDILHLMDVFYVTIGASLIMWFSRGGSITRGCTIRVHNNSLLMGVRTNNSKIAHLCKWWLTLSLFTIIEHRITYLPHFINCIYLRLDDFSVYTTTWLNLCKVESKQ